MPCPSSQPGRAADRQLAGIQPAVCSTDPSGTLQDPLCACAAQMSCTCSSNPTRSGCLSPLTRVRVNCAAHGWQSTRRNLAHPAGERESNSRIFICVPGSRLRCANSLSRIFFRSMQLSIRHTGPQGGRVLNSKLVCRANVNYNACLLLLAYK